MTASLIRNILLNMTGKDLEPENQKWLSESDGNPVMRVSISSYLVPSFNDLLNWNLRYPNSCIIQDGKELSRDTNTVVPDKEALFLVFFNGREIPFLFLYRPNEYV